jgi:hypothetical protein
MFPSLAADFPQLSSTHKSKAFYLTLLNSAPAVEPLRSGWLAYYLMQKVCVVNRGCCAVEYEARLSARRSSSRSMFGETSGLTMCIRSQDNYLVVTLQKAVF